MGFEELIEKALENEEDNESKNIVQYLIHPDGSLSGTGKTTKKGFNKYYDITKEYNEPLKLIPHKIKTDELIAFNNSGMEKIIEDINSFWNKADTYAENGLLHRRGILLYGKNGGGKTSVVNLIIKYLIENNGIVLNASNKPHLVVGAIKLIRSIEPDRHIICLFEDIDELIQRYGEADILALLDGDKSTNHVLNIATTNYTDKLPKRMKSRPRRFDRIIRIDLPDENIREQFFRRKLKVDEEILQRVIKKTEGFSMAALTEVVVSMNCYDLTIEETCKIIHSQLNFEDTFEEVNRKTVKGFCFEEDEPYIIGTENEDLPKAED